MISFAILTKNRIFQMKTKAFSEPAAIIFRNVSSKASRKNEFRGRLRVWGNSSLSSI